MNMKDIKSKAKSMGLEPGKIKKVELVRTIQRKEGNSSCFQTGVSAQCSQEYCCWREDCLAVECG